MVFSSAHFLFYFLPIFLVVYQFTPATFKKYLLLIASLYFYAWGAPVFIFTVIGSCLLDFYLIKQFEKSEHKKKIMLFSLVINILILLYFKYANFFVENVNDWLTSPFEWSEILLPIGISFFTFQKISYLLDIYWKREKHLENFSDYLLYILLFPQLIAGPIVRFKDINSQLVNFAGNIDIEQRLEGVFRFVIGLSKKVLIANSMGALVVQIKSVGIENLDTPLTWLMALAYSFQLYFDFSGYSDMAIGLGKMMGFSFPENFNFPYVSKSITDFWQRWHITLGSWMRDYLYIPLGGNKVSKGRLYLNLFLVFLISGFWHGAAWGFIIWGMYHGLFLIIERLFLGKILLKIPKIISLLYTFLIVTIGWVFFSNDFKTAIELIQKMFSFSHNESLSFVISSKTTLFLIVAVVMSFMGGFSMVETRLNNLSLSIVKSSTGVFILGFLIIITLLIWSSIAIVAEGFNPFIYYRF